MGWTKDRTDYWRKCKLSFVFSIFFLCFSFALLCFSFYFLFWFLPFWLILLRDNGDALMISCQHQTLTHPPPMGTAIKIRCIFLLFFLYLYFSFYFSFYISFCFSIPLSFSPLFFFPSFFLSLLSFSRLRYRQERDSVCAMLCSGKWAKMGSSENRKL